MDINQSIRAILDEYYEGESYLESSDESDRSDVIDDIDNDLVLSRSSPQKDRNLPSEMTTHESQSSVENTKETYFNTVSPASSGECKLNSTSQPTKSIQSFDGINQNLSTIQTNETTVSQKDNLYQSLEKDFTERNITSSLTQFPHNIGQLDEVLMSSDDSTIKNHNGIPNENIEVSRLVNNNTKLTRVLPSDQKDSSSQDSYQRKKETKPFLKKGSRKEPSSLQRMKNDVLRNGMRFKNEARIEDEVTSEKTNVSSHLKHLERMQEEQREHLQKRLERREKARIAIKQKKIHNKTQSMDKKKVVQDHIACKSEQSHDSNDRKGCSSSDSSSGDLSSDDESSDSSSNEDISFEKNDQRMTSPQFTSRNATKTIPILTKQTNRGRVSSSSRFLKRSQESKEQFKEFKSPEIKEQWQVIKSMRKRQEAALRSAEKKREEVSNVRVLSFYYLQITLS